MQRNHLPLLLCLLLGPGLFGQYNFQLGTVRFDSNGNGIYELSDPPLPGWGMRSGPTGRLVSTDYRGEYYFEDTIFSAHIDTLSIIGLTSIGAWSIPSEYVLSIPPGSAFYDSSLHFLVQLPPGLVDASGQFMLPWPAAMPGVDLNIGLHVANTGNTVCDITADFQGDTIQDWVSSYPPPLTQIGTGGTWFFPAMQPMQDTMISIIMSTHATAQLGAPVLSTMMVSTPGDAQLYNNVDTLAKIVAAPGDPNFKQAYPPLLSVQQGMSGAEVAYAIHFQNTGTAPAQNILVTDTLDTRLDPQSLLFVGSSHYCTWSVVGNVLKFQFTYIQLPDSGTNEPASHGFVQFNIRTTGGQQAGEVIPNAANIYFDFNPPVITGDCELTVEMPTAIPEVVVTDLRLYPNPTTGEVMLEITGPRSVPSTAELCDALGRLERTFQITSRTRSLSLEGLAPGIHVLRLMDPNGIPERALRLVLQATD